MLISKDKHYILCLIFITVLLLQGCGSNGGENVTPNASSVISVTAETNLEATQTAQQAGDGVTELDKETGESAILDNDVTLKDIAAFLNLDQEELQNGYEDIVETRIYDECYNEYLYSDMGVNIVCYLESLDDFIVKYVELSRDRISFKGITSSADFNEVMKKLGKAKVYKLEDGLPGLVTYELRYKYNGINLRVYSWDKDGKGGIHMSVVDGFLPEYRPIRITPEQIGHYFRMTREEIEREIGKGNVLSYNENAYEYPEYGVVFGYDEQGGKLKSLDLRSNYQIDDLKRGVSIEDAIAVMGPAEVKILETDNDKWSEIVYEYDNVVLSIIYSFEDHWTSQYLSSKS